MSLVKIQGNASGTGEFTIAAPNSNTNRTLTLPDATGTVQVSGNAISGTTGSFSSDLSFNSGYGSAAVAYGCRAWVNFNGTGTVAIRASGNVSSITDNGNGDYTVNFTTAMPDANYAVNVSTPMYITTNGSVLARIYGSATVGSAGLQTTTQIRVCWTDISAPANFYDPAMYYVSVFR
jgi:uncharacterized protein (AIM24 family)